MIQRIGIIGGAGKMGAMFEQQFRQIGKEVLIHDLNQGVGLKELVHESELVILSVPLGTTKDVVKEIKPWLTPEHLLSDFSSVKNKAVPAMLETEAHVISAHPMFGPMPSIAGQNVILMPVREGRWLPKYRRLYLELGLKVVELKDWKKHDQSMSFIQGLMHFLHIVFTQTLADKDVDLETLMQICSPVYRANFAFACRILSRDPHLYTHILMDNPENNSILGSFIEKAQESLKLIQKKDEEAFKRNFLHSKDFLGDYGNRFVAESDFLVDQLQVFDRLFEKLQRS